MEKKVTKYKYIHCDVWKTGISVFIGDTSSLLKWAKKIYREAEEQDMIHSIEMYGTEEDYEEKRVVGRLYHSDSGQYIVHVPAFSFTFNPTEISILSHELLHATFLMLDFLGVEYRYTGSNEPYTYTHEYLLKEALKEKGYKEFKG